MKIELTITEAIRLQIIMEREIRQTQDILQDVLSDNGFFKEAHKHFSQELKEEIKLLDKINEAMR